MKNKEDEKVITIDFGPILVTAIIVLGSVLLLLGTAWFVTVYARVLYCCLIGLVFMVGLALSVSLKEESTQFIGISITFVACVLMALPLLPAEAFEKYESNGSSNNSGSVDAIYVIRGREKLKASLKDPWSLSIIKENVVYEHGSYWYYCEYRAKNSFGGYVVDIYFTEL